MQIQNPMYTVVLEPVDPSLRTKWHPTEETGPFQKLTRGVFKSIESAYKWTADNGIQAGFMVRAINNE